MAFSSLRPLRHRNFALIWSAALVSNAGSWMQAVAVSALVTDLTHKSFWTGLVAAAAFLPIGVFSPIGGAIADRIDRRRFFLATTAGETFFAALLAYLVATGHGTPGVVTLVVLGGGVLTALGLPAYQAIIPDLVPREDLLAAMSLGAAQFNLGRVVGPAAGLIAIVAGSYSLVFAINAASFGAVMVALVALRLPEHSPDSEGGTLRQRIRTGIRAARAEPGCRTAILTIGVTALLISPFIALIPAVSINLLHRGAEGTFVLVTAQGIGAVAGALAMPPLAERFGRRRVLLTDLALVLPAVVVLYALGPNLVLAALALAAVGAAYIGVLSGLITVVQLRAPDALRGRILSLFMVALGVVYPLGAILQGKLGDLIGLRVVTATAAVLFAAFVALVLGRRADLRVSLDEPSDRVSVTPASVPGAVA